MITCKFFKLSSKNVEAVQEERRRYVNCISRADELTSKNRLMTEKSIESFEDARIQNANSRSSIEDHHRTSEFIRSCFGMRTASLAYG